MKYSEFEEKVEELGFDYRDEGDVVHVYLNNLRFLHIIKNKVNDLRIESLRFDGNNKLKLLKLATELAETPLEEREEPKKYYLKHVFLKGSVRGCGYLNKDISGGVYFISNEKTCDDEFQATFTSREIEEIKDWYGATLKDFEMIEVVEPDFEIIDGVQEED